MDLNQDETIATDDDSGEADQSFYLSRSAHSRLTAPGLHSDPINVAKMRDLQW